MTTRSLSGSRRQPEALFVDPYPPFGDESYPATIDLHEPAQPRDRATIAIRLLLVIPHFVLPFFLLLGWLVTTVIAWFAILFTRSYPASLYPYGAGVMRWGLRVEAYLLRWSTSIPIHARLEARRQIGGLLVRDAPSLCGGRPGEAELLNPVAHLVAIDAEQLACAGLVAV